MAPKPSTNPLNRFALATDEERYRLVGCSVGEPGSRKTSFWLEGPGPIGIISLDQGLEGVVSRIMKDANLRKEVRVAEYEWFPTKDEDMQAQAIEIRDQLLEAYEIMVNHCRTILIDKETDVWGLFRYADFGPGQNDEQKNYAALNQRYTRFINLAKSKENLNIGFIDGMKDEWVKKKNHATGKDTAGPSGNRMRAGFGGLEGLVHQVLWHSGTGPDDWNIYVSKCRGPEMTKLAGKDQGNLTFSEFGQLLFPDSDESDWV